MIGPNGAGKTTLFRMILGEEPPDAGTIRVGETVKLGYIDQNRTLDPDKTIFEEITGGTRARAARTARDELARVRGALQLLRLRISRRRSACSPAASAIACISPRC